MMRHLITLLLTSLALASSGQSADRGKVHLDLTSGLAIHSLYGNMSPSTAAMGASISSAGEIAYCAQDGLSLGLSVRTDLFLIDSTDVKSLTVVGGAISFTTKYHLLNREKSNVYIGSEIGVGGAKIETLDSLDVKSELHMNGTYLEANLGWRKYFGKSFGINLELGYFFMPFDVNQYVVDGQDQEYYHRGLKSSNVKFNFSGLQVRGGFTFKFGNE